jgi:hypothetical protein
MCSLLGPGHAGYFSAFSVLATVDCVAHSTGAAAFS